MADHDIVLNVHYPETYDVEYFKKLLESLKKHAYKDKYLAKKEHRKQSVVSLAKTPSDKISLPEMQVILHGNVVNTQNIHDKTTLKDVKEFIKVSYFKATFKDISDFNRDGYPRYFNTNKFSVVYFGDADSKNGKELVKWVMKIQNDHHYQDIHYYYTTKSLFGLKENEAGLFKSSDKRFRIANIEESFFSEGFESWFFVNQIEGAQYLNRHHKSRFEKKKQNVHILYVDSMSDSKSINAIKEFKSASKHFQDESKLTYIVNVSQVATRAAKEFAMERGFMPNKHSLPVVVCHYIVKFDKDLYENTTVMKTEINHDNLVEFKTQTHDDAEKDAEEGKEPEAETETALGLVKDKLYQDVNYQDMISSELQEMTEADDVVILYYFSQFWDKNLNDQAVEDFNIIVEEFSKLESPKIRFLKYDMANSFPNAMNVNMHEAPVIRLHNHTKSGAYIDLHYLGEEEKEILEFLVTNCSTPNNYKENVKLPEKTEEMETDL